MKKTTMMMLTVAALVAAACSSDDEEQQQTLQPGGGWSEYVTVTAGAPGSAEQTSAKADGPLRVKVNSADPQKSLWETGDQLTIWTGSCTTANMSEHGFTLISGDNTATAKFGGRLVSETAPTSTTTLYAVIDNGSDAIDASAGTSVTANLSVQQGATAATAMDYELYYATSTNGERNFTFTHQMALVKWTIKVNGGIDNGDPCNIVLSGTGLKNAATLDPATGTLTPAATDGTITLKNVILTSAAGTDVYVVLPPCTCPDGIKAKLTMADGERYCAFAFGSLGFGAISVEGNKYYTAGTNEFTLNVVDLGLPSGTLWSTYNLGATSPEEYGDFFAWGETTGYSSESTSDGHLFNWPSYRYGGYSNLNIMKYTFADGNTEGDWYDSDGFFIGDGLTRLEHYMNDDAPHVNWDMAWSMPIKAQWKELITCYPFKDLSHSKHCYWTDNYKNTGVKGLAFYDIDDNIVLFLPAAGCRETDKLRESGLGCYYWSCDLNDDDSYVGSCLIFYAGGGDADDSCERCWGLAWRPVLNPHGDNYLKHFDDL